MKDKKEKVLNILFYVFSWLTIGLAFAGALLSATGTSSSWASICLACSLVGTVIVDFIVHSKK